MTFRPRKSFRLSVNRWPDRPDRAHRPVDPPGRRAHHWKPPPNQPIVRPEIGTAFMQTFVRVREQLHSNLIGLQCRRACDIDDRSARCRSCRDGLADRGHRRGQCKGDEAAGERGRAAGRGALLYRWFSRCRGRAFACLLFYSTDTSAAISRMTTASEARGQESYRRVTSFLLRTTKGPGLCAVAEYYLWLAEL